MEKKILLFMGLCLASAGFAMAEGFVLHGGAGYHISFLGTPIEVGVDEDVPDSNTIGADAAGVYKSMPLGLAMHLGAGYGFLGSVYEDTEDMFVVGGEAVLGMAMSLKPLGALHFFIQGRALGRYAPLEYLSVVGFAGVKGNLALSKSVMPRGVYPVFGIRIEPAFFFLEYAAVLRGNFSNVYSHDITIGATW